MSELATCLMRWKSDSVRTSPLYSPHHPVVKFRRLGRHEVCIQVGTPRTGMISIQTDLQARSLVAFYDQLKSSPAAKAGTGAPFQATFEEALAKVWKQPSPVELEAGASVLMAHFAHRDHAISTRPPSEHERIEAGLHSAVDRVLHLA